MNGMMNRGSSSNQGLVNSVCSAFNQYDCEKRPEHQNYEFICTASDCPYDRLVCADCLKTDPRHIQLHGSKFQRMHDFVAQLCSAESLTQGRERDVEEVKAMTKRVEKVRAGFEETVVADLGKIQGLFKRLEKTMVDMVQKKLKGLCEAMTCEYRSLKDLDKLAMNEYLEYSRGLVGFEGNAAVRDLDHILRKKAPNSLDLFRNKVGGLIDMVDNYDKCLGNWFKKSSRLIPLSEVEMKSIIDFRAIDIYVSKILFDLNDCLSTISSEPFTLNMVSRFRERLGELDHQPRPMKQPASNSKKQLPSQQSSEKLRTSMHLPYSLGKEEHPRNSRMGLIDSKIDELLNSPPKK